MKKWLKVIALILSIALFIQLPVYAVEQSEIEPQTEPVASEEEETPDEEIEPAAPAEGELPSEPEPEESLPPEESESSPEPETPEERETDPPSEAPAPDEPEPEDPVTLVEGDVGGTVAENETAMPQDEEAAAEIIGEDESRREENVKHFLRSDGSYTAVQYRKPVHYRETDEDAWQDIDNTLVPDVQPPEPAPGEETGSLSGETGDDPAASEDPVAPSAEAVWYVPASSPVDVAFAQDSACESLVRYQSGEYTLAWRYARTAASVVTGEQESFAPEESAERDGAEFYLEALSGGIVYRNLLPNIDVEYVVTSNLLKENLILKSRAVQSAIVAVYEIGNLQAEQKSATEIALKDGDKTVFTIVAPVMMDASEAQSTALTMTILSEANGELRLRLNADRAWLDAPERVYPVTIDPYIHEGIVDYADDESALYSTPSSGRPYGTLVVGKNSDYGKCRSYMKFDLPTLEAGDMVIGGTLNVAQYSGSYGFSAVGKTSMQINAYQVLGSWTESSIQNSSAFSGLPQCDTAVMDYVKVGEKSEMGWVSLDVTQAVRDWYGGVSPNYGLCLQSETESDYAVACFVASNNYSYPTATPTLTVSYLNNKGLEDRWTYHAQSVGEKCTTYVNDYTGNLVTIADIASSSGSIAPFTIQAVYNGYQKGKYAETPTKIGKGFRLNISQTMVQITDGPDALSKALYKAGFRYKYTDGDGTVHYFKAKKDTTDQFEDEEGLGLTLKVLGDANLVEGQKYELASDKGGKITFLKSGKLRAVYDTDGNRYRLTYNESGTVFRVYDSAERHFSFTYDANNNVTKITDPAGREITFTYDESVRIKTLTYPDGTTNNFRWSNSRMRLARGTDGRMIAFGYPESGDEATISRVTKITEYDKSGTQETANEGGHIEIDYGRNRYTKFTDHKGRTEKYLFDRVGRTVNVVAADGSITTAGYTGTSGKTANRIKKLTTGTKHVNNLLKNHSFESDGASWNLTDAAVATDKAYLGNKAAKVTQAGRISQPCYNVTSGTYTASAWIKTGAATTNAVVRMRAYDANSSYLGEAMSEPITYVTDWERRHVTWTLPENTAHIRVEVVTSGAGTAWADCFQLESGYTMNEYNLLENSDFANGSTCWSSTNTTSADGVANYNDSTGDAYRLYGSADANKLAYQKVFVNKKAGDIVFRISGNARGNAVPLKGDRHFAIGLHTKYSDGTNTYNWKEFNTDVTEWQFTTEAYPYSSENASKTISYVYYRLIYYGQENRAWFDNVQLSIDQTGTTYTYDANGNVISAKDNAKRKQSYTYSSANELTSATTEDNKEYTYTYGSGEKAHQLKSAVSKSSNLKFSFWYDEKGNVTKTRTTAVDSDGNQKTGTKRIETSATYTDDGNYKLKDVDARGKATTYSYNTTKGTLTSVTDPAGNTVQYTYNANNDRLLTVASGATTNQYTYHAKGILTEIESPTATYTFGYDAF